MKRTIKNMAVQAAAVTILTSMSIIGCQPVDVDSSATKSSSTANARLSAGQDYVDGELLLQFKEGTSDDIKQKAFDKVKGIPAEKILTKAMERASKKEGLLLVKVNKNVLEAIADLSGAEGVAFAEPNFIYSHTAVSTDPYFTNGSLWGMDAKNTYGSQASTAWAAGNTGSASVVVGVIDEGIQFDHPDLAGQVWTNPFDPVDGKDNDGNGYVDDIHGWDFDGNNNTIYDGTTRGSSDDHGTHVSGTIGGKANNGQGVVGMNWNITIISCKFLGRKGGTTANAVKAVDYLNDLKTRHGLNIVASNNSWGGGGFSQALYDAVNRANTKNILFVAAAGNGGSDGVGDNNDVVASYPSNMDLPNVIAVAAITSTGALSSFSNYGATTVDIGAPGQAIWSSTAYNIYESYSGTSMATPHVTGAVALYASVKPGSTAAQIKAAILNSAVSTPSLNGKTVTGGRLNVNAALAL
ncbi:S8 family peptidase [Spirosoma linguale]|uniref:Peptidase S8 and S53 subtilisin kexin sedolisin n=1 Tax=Spirosoma linguale (strain ATCC 33905 / DSM 74 / LMG 10896 / Claus 1) TaxID=504472 RepID=D2QK16_SPILD|nr:peptidase S8 and S53 subtilisin kexin sedolisin [Spirosoma linguale DSM 74]